MIRRRMINPSIWQDPSFNGVCIEARLLFIGMLSNADDDGYLRADAGSLKRTVFGFDAFTREEVGAWLDQLSSFRSMHFYEIDGEKYAHFVKWKRYQLLRDDRRVPSEHPVCVKCVSSGQPTAAEGKGREVKESKVKGREESGVAGATTPKGLAKEFFESDAKRVEFAEALILKGLRREFVLQELAKFVNYWAELTPSGKKQRWETEKTFEVQRRLAKWFANAQMYQKNKGKQIIGL